MYLLPSLPLPPHVLAYVKRAGEQASWKGKRRVCFPSDRALAAGGQASSKTRGNRWSVSPSARGRRINARRRRI